jgi:hypothetical protein
LEDIDVSVAFELPGGDVAVEGWPAPAAEVGWVSDAINHDPLLSSVNA